MDHQTKIVLSQHLVNGIDSFSFLKSGKWFRELLLTSHALSFQTFIANILKNSPSNIFELTGWNWILTQNNEGHSDNFSKKIKRWGSRDRVTHLCGVLFRNFNRNHSLCYAHWFILNNNKQANNHNQVIASYWFNNLCLISY